MLKSAWRRVLKSLGDRWMVDDVPVELEPCEFECRTPQCDGERWEKCARRRWHVEQHHARQPERAGPV